MKNKALCERGKRTREQVLGPEHKRHLAATEDSFGPGSNIDIVARLLAQKLNDNWGQSVIEWTQS